MISRAGSFRADFFLVRNDLPGGFLPLGIFFVRNILSGGAFPCVGLLPGGVLFRAGFSSAIRTGAIAGRVSACSGPRPLSRPLFPVPSFPSPLSRPLFSVPSFLSPEPVADACRRCPSPMPVPGVRPRCLLQVPVAGRAPRRAFPCLSACRWTLPGAFFRVPRACGCPRRTVVPRSVFDSLLKSPGPVLGIPPNFSYLWMQKMSFAALKTYRTE